MCSLETSEGRVAMGEIEQGAERPLVGCLKTLKVVFIPYGNVYTKSKSSLIRLDKLLVPAELIFVFS